MANAQPRHFGVESRDAIDLAESTGSFVVDDSARSRCRSPSWWPDLRLRRAFTVRSW